MRTPAWFLGLAGLLCGAAPVGAQPPAVQSAADLLRRDRGELDALFRAAEAAPHPAGFVPGRVIASPGTPTKPGVARLTRAVWQGKIFREDGTMINRVFGVFRAVPATVAVGPSRVDGRPALVIDYADSGRAFRDIRDEVREVAPGVYLGLTFQGAKPEPIIYFALDGRWGR